MVRGQLGLNCGEIHRPWNHIRVAGSLYNITTMMIIIKSTSYAKVTKKEKNDKLQSKKLRTTKYVHNREKTSCALISAETRYDTEYLENVRFTKKLLLNILQT